MELFKEASEVVSAAEMVSAGTFGHTCIMIGLICMAVSTAYFYYRAMTVSANGSNFFEVLTMTITGIATLAYMTMFSGSGFLWVAESSGSDVMYPLYYARYIDWILTTPLMVWDVLALAGAKQDDIIFTVFVDVLMIAFGLIGAMDSSVQKWPFFIVGMLCFFHVVYMLMKYMKANPGKPQQRLYSTVAGMTIVLWTLYPIVWIIAEGGRFVSPGLEACLYMIMDVSSKCIFGFIIVGARSTLEEITSGYKGV